LLLQTLCGYHVRQASRQWDNAVKKRTWTLLALLLLTVCGYVAVIAIPQEAIHVQRSPVKTSPADVGLAFGEFVVSPEDSNLQLAGWWIPAQGARATLVFIHGGGSNRTSSYFGSLDFYRAMVDQGIALVVIDLRNHGESGGDGIGLQFGRTEKYDAMAAISWARAKNPNLPLFAMGISMGGATLIQAVYDGTKLDGLILFDSLLDTADTFKQGAWVETGLPPALFAISVWSATRFYGLPGGEEQALDRAALLDIPILAIQDPDDPVTRARFSRELAQRNSRVTLWTAPAIDPNHPDLAWKERWGSHVSAFQFFPQETVAQILAFIESSAVAER
jgi:pimeloyl-ACP methyl ester carboxylesterase